MSIAAEAPFALKIPVHQKDVYAGLIDDQSWAEEFPRVCPPYEVRLLAEGQIGPRIWVRLTSYTIGEGGDAGSIWIEIASRRPSPAEIVAGRGLLRAFSADSSERRRLLGQMLLHIVLLEYTDETRRPLWYAPSTAYGVRGALVGAETVGSPAIWKALNTDLARSRPSTVIALRDAGGVPGLEAFDGFATSPIELPAAVRRRVLGELDGNWSRFGGVPDPRRGFKWVRRQLGPSRELEAATSISSLMRFGERRRKYDVIPRRLAEGELGVYYPRDADEAATCAAASLIPIAPGLFWDVLGGTGGDPQTTAGHAHKTQGASSFTPLATAMTPERRANFLLGAAAAAIVSVASRQTA